MATPDIAPIDNVVFAPSVRLLLSHGWSLGTHLRFQNKTPKLSIHTLATLLGRKWGLAQKSLHTHSSIRTSTQVIIRKTTKNIKPVKPQYFFHHQAKRLGASILKSPRELIKDNHIISLARLFRRINLSNRIDLGLGERRVLLMMTETWTHKQRARQGAAVLSRLCWGHFLGCQAARISRFRLCGCGYFRMLWLPSCVLRWGDQIKGV